ncbi:hypothetical protein CHINAEXTREME_16875 [Halobiforma lacisalsi AJ5]|uniref:Uncharacterized protein n=2 Tax=Natronobacterium lacisalsi TaxID=229731 RepID=M0LNZ7_NATLA|nr:hypothetical protein CHINAEXTREME_16875 [Halobiforma lacisalsi AJ5]EMA35226.1 hypothetical protein C445_05888 [Halobiforma lacisalsi AJ5]
MALPAVGALGLESLLLDGVDPGSRLGGSLPDFLVRTDRDPDDRPTMAASDRSSGPNEGGQRASESNPASSVSTDETELEGGDEGGFEATDEVETDGVEVTVHDCETVRIEGSVDEVILAAFWWDESGLLGTIAEPIGGVDGERVISVSDAFGSFAHGPILSEVQGFRAGTPTVPGNGDWTVSNPSLERCIERVRDRYDGPGDLEGPFPDSEGSERKR